MSDVNKAQPATPRSTVLSRTLASESFIEKVVLLVLTAFLSGVIVPLIVKSIDRARERRESVSRAQAKLYEDVSETILTYETLALDVSWYGMPDARNADMQQKALERYNERTVDLVARWRSQSSRAQTLVSPQFASKLDDFLNDAFVKQDTPINRMWGKCASTCDWTRQHAQSIGMLAEANELIAELGNDLGLSKE